MPERYPGYDVLAKRHSPSWNEQTRRVIDRRLAMPREPRFFTEAEWRTLNFVCDGIIPQPKHRPPVPIAAMIDQKVYENHTDGFRNSRLPKMQEAWRRGLHAIEQEAQARHGAAFDQLAPQQQDALLQDMQKGELSGPAWGDMPCKLFFTERLLHDIIHAYYSHPTAWSEIGFGGPASPRGYVRMGFNRRDPWEAAEAHPGQEEAARRENRRVG
ncbi:MAG: gluconate 2-dehydrogenase subunit 3 family protein [Acetobacteraceae bacterium]|nr:gluconate 2-dehydrogenase subunit 3 family protein [Acetobacteraceae bacterium]